ncbi:MAG: hypothetical protein II234_05195 [Clostridia bacterium]|nr:hypothetical protein [Clostridia bacterium]
MDNTIIVAIISFLGTLIGTAGGIIASGKLTEYRLTQLEKKVDAQNSISSRIPLIEEKISSMGRRVAYIEKEHNISRGYAESGQ